MNEKQHIPLTAAAKFTPAEPDLVPIEFLLVLADPTNEDISGYAEDWAATPPQAEFTNLLQAETDDN